MTIFETEPLFEGFEYGWTLADEGKFPLTMIDPRCLHPVLAMFRLYDFLMGQQSYVYHQWMEMNGKLT